KDLRGVMPYLAPELLSGRGSYSRATDIYAIGFVMWEISSEEPPFHQFDHDTQLALRICQGYRPEIAGDTPPFYRDLLQKCWHTDPTRRPTAEEIDDCVLSWRKDGIYNGEFTKVIQDQIDAAEEIRRQHI